LDLYYYYRTDLKGFKYFMSGAELHRKKVIRHT